MNWIAFFAGLMVGGSLGTFAFALMQAGRDHDRP